MSVKIAVKQDSVIRKELDQAIRYQESVGLFTYAAEVDFVRVETKSTSRSESVCIGHSKIRSYNRWLLSRKFKWGICTWFPSMRRKQRWFERRLQSEIPDTQISATVTEAVHSRNQPPHPVRSVTNELVQFIHHIEKIDRVERWRTAANSVYVPQTFQGSDYKSWRVLPRWIVAK